jgi:hypothetical protein
VRPVEILRLWNDRHMRRKATDRPSASRGTAVVLAVAVGVVTVATARHNPDESLAGDSLAAQIAELVAGWLLVVVGLTHRARYRRNRFAMLVVAAGIAWCLPEWVNPGVDSGLVFTAGLLGAAACPPLLLHAALTYPDRRLTSRLERGSVALAYVGALLVLGLLPALVFAPVAQGCFECPRNLLLVHADAGLYSALLR